MDLATLLGLVMGLVMVLFGIVSSGGVAALGNFIDVPSVIITIGGSLTSVLSCNKMADFTNGFKGFGLALKEPAVGSAADTDDWTTPRIFDMVVDTYTEELPIFDASTQIFNFDETLNYNGIFNFKLNITRPSIYPTIPNETYTIAQESALELRFMLFDENDQFVNAYSTAVVGLDTTI